ncbi:MAG TPA: BMP family ABC transporter substrate-binding protein [Lachnospiraceae bacterium]|nr:BMP family ABC transporter substrate-binding protein [Lachnospiraceae bacterium]
MKQRIIAVMMSLAVALGISGCAVTTGGTSTEKAAGSAGTEQSGGGLKIAIVTSPSGVDDGSFNEDNYNGILSFIEDHPESEVTPVRETTGDTNACINAVSDIVADYDVIVCDGFQFAGITEIAEDNPDTKFILVDTSPTDAEGNEVELDNIYAMTFKEQEGGFLAGIAAAMTTVTGKVAVVNGIAYPTNVNYQYGFMSGVNYSNRHYGTNAEIVELASYAGTDVTGANVGGNYIGSFADPATGKVIGDALLKEGCDVIFVAAGDSGNGVFTAVKESKDKAYVIGCDTDQYDDGANGDSNIILTSSLKIMGVNDKRVLETVLDGSFKGGNYLLGIDTDSVGYVSEEGRCQLSAEAIANIDKAYELVKNGTIVPAANFNGLTPDDFTGIDVE